ncbi:MAG: DNA polymerase I [Ruminococcaceae bacterium]|nr:DNA polymerase I [Oscillospiraceae bacterium]
MILLAIDGNSLLNRAFYGIKLLSNKKGQFTNAIYGFMKMLINLRDEVNPDAVVVAFDRKAPTFRHEMYSEYKAGRKPMPEELFSQMPIVKKLISLLGYRIIEIDTWEADDILGTLASGATEKDFCYIATGDRDSLQLIDKNVHVLLATTKMGNVRYDTNALMEEYGVSPSQMIEIKALQGDTSDNIPGVAGIGPKTAGDLIQSYGSIDGVYEALPEMKITSKMREKLENGKESAYLSRKLGTISRDVPISKNYEDYLPFECKKGETAKLLHHLEIFSLNEKLGLDGAEFIPDEESSEIEIKVKDSTIDEVKSLIEKNDDIYFLCEFSGLNVAEIYFSFDETVYTLSSLQLGFDDFLLSFLADENKKKFTTETKLLHAYAMANGSVLQNVGFDISLAGYILNPSSNDYTVSRLAKEYSVQVKSDSEDEFILSAGALKTLSDKMSAEIEKNSQSHLMHDIEIPLSEVLASMELEGFKVDKEGIISFGQKLENDIKILQENIYEEVGYEFNINSPKQLGVALFEDLGLPAKKKTKSGYSTNADVLEDLKYAHPVIQMILDYRTFAKLKSTYCDGLVKVIGDDGRIHSTLNQTETRTGRISSAEPNLQNIPVRSPLGREMRKFFSADEGKVLVDADYSQIELRVLADIANDKTMIDSFNSDRDIHTETASQVFNMPENMVTPLMRSRAKAVNFGIVYGIGAFSLAKDIGVTRKEADQYIKGYLNHFSGVDRYMKEVISDAKERGYAETLFARRRYLPELSASNAITRGFGERVARNMPIQGTAADIIKIAMIKVYNRLKNENLSSKLILQVHDELIVEATESEAETVKKILSEEMENACQMKVKLKADVQSGKTWYDCK